MALPRPQARFRSSERVLAAVSRLIDRRRGWFQALADVGAWTIGLLIALWGAHGACPPGRRCCSVPSPPSCSSVPRSAAACTQSVAVRVPRGDRGLLGPILATVGLALVDALLLQPAVPLANLCSAVAFATVLMGGLRYTWRLLIDTGTARSPADRSGPSCSAPAGAVRRSSPGC